MNQCEITFPGGIWLEMIWYLHEYRGTRLVQAWQNPLFDLNVNPPNHTPHLHMLPLTPTTNNFVFNMHPSMPPAEPVAISMIPIVDPLVLFASPFPPDSCPSIHDDDGDDLMFGDDGEEFDDDIYNVTPLPLTCIVGVIQPLDTSHAYIFCGNRYVGIQVIPGTGTTHLKDHCQRLAISVVDRFCWQDRCHTTGSKQQVQVDVLFLNGELCCH